MTVALKTSVEEIQSLNNDTDGISKPPEASNALKAEESGHEYITGMRLGAILASVTLVVFLVMLDMSIVVTAIPQITSDFHSLHDVGWYGSAYLLSTCALQPLTGKLYSQFSLKYTFLIFLGLFELGSVICGTAQSSNMMIIGRALAGLGCSGLFNGALTILSTAAPMHKQPVMLGIMMAISQIGIISGPLIGGAFTQYASWRWCFYINLPIGAVSSILLLLIKIPDRLNRKTADKPTALSILSKLDPIGFFLFASFAVMFLLALEWGGTTYPWNNATIIGLFCGSGGTLVIFVAWEHRVGDDAMIPYSMVRKRVIWSSSSVAFFFFGALLIFSYYLPIYFQAVKGVSPALSGVYLLPGILSQILMVLVSGALVGKLGYYLPWGVGGAVVMAVSAGLISTFTPYTTTIKWVMYQIIGGIGRGAAMQIPVIAIQNNLPQEQIPVGMAFLGFLQTFGGSLLLAFAQTIFSHSLVSGLQKYAPTADAQAIIAAGATAFRQVIKPEELTGVLQAYNVGINHTFYLSAGGSAAAFVFCWGMGWRKVDKKKADTSKV
ncbi:efflux pump [Lepidopterella palustris CBS 459.81]|uniref:Efflux pump n=1 Tax=Lepidopterella palustris CBS 459.81 TaxID=1314670 RepID=A0A8E2E2Q3_9PEZI|nr:efflux pump [Lepidopterella palustris CBS 459.81]